MLYTESIRRRLWSFFHKFTDGKLLRSQLDEVIRFLRIIMPRPWKQLAHSPNGLRLVRKGHAVSNRGASHCLASASSVTKLEPSRKN